MDFAGSIAGHSHAVANDGVTTQATAFGDVFTTLPLTGVRGCLHRKYAEAYTGLDPCAPWFLSERLQDHGIFDFGYIRFLDGRQSADFLYTPNVVRDSGFHCGGHTQGLMDSPEIVVQEIERDHVTVIVHLFREAIGQARKAPHSHPH